VTIRQTVGGARVVEWRKPRGRSHCEFHTQPFRTRESGGALRIRDHVTYAAALDPVVDIGARQLRCRWNHNGAKADRREHGFPERHDVCEHEENPIAPLHAGVTQITGNTPRAVEQFSERDRFRSLVRDDTQRDAPIALRELIEPVRGPIE
jgi:hypothetical protein